MSMESARYQFRIMQLEAELAEMVRQRDEVVAMLPGFAEITKRYHGSTIRMDYRVKALRLLQRYDKLVNQWRTEKREAEWAAARAKRDAE